MGDRFQVIVDLDASEADAGRLGRRVVDRLVAEGIVLAERTKCVLGQPLGHPPGPHWERAVTDDWDFEPWDGLAVHTRRTGFTSGADKPGAALCPHCGASTPLEDVHWQRFGTAIRTWHDTGAATVDCPTCAHPVPVPDWTWDEAPLAFGTLGFEFWNWPELSDDFRARLAALLDGHRTAYVWGKI
ncbi:hypothetical protein GCM10010377_29850 [Streptomyces viridiviolaceus]|uniref:Uncharacterized protein n=1 Tax=Streptomyces viridiviolaceus TaxID=68282 RepID=A0ABW2EE30_9ACTN|nr:hypothetical protein [Streptomyces viridiviolaceus]GHB36928.1 hypothetical protein GCM10010377_29850 [Streptomyces viridiviolaceus]